MAQASVDRLLTQAKCTAKKERLRSAMRMLRAERVEFDLLHLATCTAGCRELLAECEWGTDDEQAEADSLLVIQPFLAPELYTKALFLAPKCAPEPF